MLNNRIKRLEQKLNLEATKNNPMLVAEKNEDGTYTVNDKTYTEAELQALKCSLLVIYEFE
jgi:hypothetical protein